MDMTLNLCQCWSTSTSHVFWCDDNPLKHTLWWNTMYKIYMQWHNLTSKVFVALYVESNSSAECLSLFLFRLVHCTINLLCYIMSSILKVSLCTISGFCLWGMLKRAKSKRRRGTASCLSNVSYTKKSFPKSANTITLATISYKSYQTM